MIEDHLSKVPIDTLSRIMKITVQIEYAGLPTQTLTAVNHAGMLIRTDEFRPERTGARKGWVRPGYESHYQPGLRNEAPGHASSADLCKLVETITIEDD